MNRHYDVLKQSPLFANIEGDGLFSLLGCLGTLEKRYKKGETVFSEGEKATHIGIVCRGEVQTERIDYDGNRTIVSNAARGDLFGEAFACAEVEQLPVSVIATEDTDVLLFDCRHITRTCCRACAFHQQIIFNLLKITAQKSIQLHQRAEIISHRTTREKLMAYLNQQAKQAGSSTFSIPFDRQALADYLEVDRSGLSAEISKLRRENILRSVKNEFELL